MSTIFQRSTQYDPVNNKTITGIDFIILFFECETQHQLCHNKL